MSASSMAVLKPRRVISQASSPVTRDFPTPPLPLAMPITFLMLLAGLFANIRDSAVRSEHEDPQCSQSWLHPDMIIPPYVFVLLLVTGMFCLFSRWVSIEPTLKK